MECYLFKKKYEIINHFDISLFEIFNDFTFLFGFANQHQKFVLFLLKLADNKTKKIYNCFKNA